MIYLIILGVLLLATITLGIIYKVLKTKKQKHSEKGDK